MVKLSEKDILNLAKLAELELNEKELNNIPNELNAILEYVNMLDKVDVTGLKPTYQVTGLVNVTREDKPIDYKLDKELLMSNLPDTSNNLIKVKRMIE